MRQVLRFAVVTLAMALAAGCSMFGSDARPKMAKVVDIKDAVPINKLWQGTVGGSGATHSWWEYNPFAVDPVNILVPVVAENGVYAAAQDGNLVRYDVKSGAQVWRIKTAQPLSAGVGSNGSLVVVGTAKGTVLAYDAADGKPLWTADVSSEVLGPPAVSKDLVVVRTADNRSYGLDAANGKRRWALQRTSPALVARSAGGAVFAGPTVFAGFPGGKLIAINAGTGSPSWEATVSTPRGTTELERISDVTSPPVVMDGVVCAVAFQGRLSCFDAANGNPLWSRDVSSAEGLAIDERFVFVTDDKGSVYAFDRGTGNNAWKSDKLSLRHLTAPVSQGRFVVVADIEGYLHFLDREDGALIGRIATDKSPIISRMTAADRVLIVQTSKGNLFAVQAQ